MRRKATKRYTVRKHTDTDYMLRDNTAGVTFGYFGLRSAAVREAAEMNARALNDCMIVPRNLWANDDDDDDENN